MTKFAVLVGDGMADDHLEELDGRTPLQAARTLNMDEIVRAGQLGQANMVPEGFTPGSDVAILSILGYDPCKYYSGRAPLEAAQLGVKLGLGAVAFRCNLVTVNDGLMKDYSAGHISNEEASEIIAFLDSALGNEQVRFHAGVGYRHLCVIQDGDLDRTHCTPPHDISGHPFKEYLPHGPRAQLLLDLMEKSQQLLAQHPVNRSRLARGQNAANMIWFWGQGRAATFPSFDSIFGLAGGVISAVDLVKGIALVTGLRPITVEGATGYYDTNYLGKAQRALECLERDDFVLVHVEAPDEAGHNGDLAQKIKAIERFDESVVGPVLEGLRRYAAYRVLVLPDHPTPVRQRTHTAGPIPFGWCGDSIPPDDFQAFNEKGAAASSLQIRNGHELMGLFTRFWSGKECV